MSYLKSIFAVLAFYVVVPALLIYFAIQVLADPESTGIFVAMKNSINQNVAPVVQNALQPLVHVVESSLQKPLVGKPIVVQNALPVSAPSPANTNTQTAENEDPNNIALEYEDQSFTAEEFLSDKFNRLPEDFKVSSDMKNRIKFWFDIYTKYSSRFAVIHDMQRPWIIYRVVDLRPVFATNRTRFAKDIERKHLIAKNLQEVRHILFNLSHKRNFSRLGAEELKLYTLLQEVGGNRQRVLARAAQRVRSQTGQKDFFRKGTISSSRYMSEMEEIFARYDLPVELTRLPLVESSFNEDAISKVGASGIWQFMPSMGKLADMRVEKQIDERNSPIKATVAAARLMLENFRILKSWPLAITAYNHGPGGVLKAARTVRSRNIADIVDKYETASFNFASQNFYSEFMAALYAEKYQDEIFGKMPKYQPLIGETVEIKYSMRLQTLTDLVGITFEEIKLFNPDLKKQLIGQNTFLPTGYKVRLPQGRGARLELFNQQAEEARRSILEMKKGTRS